MVSKDSAKLLLTLLDTATVSAKAEVIFAVAKARAELESVIQNPSQGLDKEE